MGYQVLSALHQAHEKHPIEKVQIRLVPSGLSMARGLDVVPFLNRPYLGLMAWVDAQTEYDGEE